MSVPCAIFQDGLRQLTDYGLDLSLHPFNVHPGVNVIKLFFYDDYNEAKKLERLYLAIAYQFSLIFACSTRSVPKKEASERSANWVGSGLALKF